MPKIIVFRGIAHRPDFLLMGFYMFVSFLYSVH